MNTKQISLTAVAVALCGIILYQTGCAPAQKEETPAPAMTSVERGK